MNHTRNSLSDFFFRNRKKFMMKVKTKQLVSNPNICELKIKIPTKMHQSKGIEEDIDNSISGRKMMKKSSQLSQAWSLGSLMTDFPPSPDSFHSSVSPSLHCDSCRPSTVFYSPRFQVFCFLLYFLLNCNSLINVNVLHFPSNYAFWIFFLFFF